MDIGIPKVGKYSLPWVQYNYTDIPHGRVEYLVFIPYCLGNSGGLSMMPNNATEGTTASSLGALKRSDQDGNSGEVRRSTEDGFCFNEHIPGRTSLM